MIFCPKAKPVDIPVGYSYLSRYNRFPRISKITKLNNFTLSM